MKQYKNLLVSGCSFSQDGIGGMPPSFGSSGSCSFMSDPDYTPAQPRTWPGFLARRLGITSLVNTAASGHGNLLVAQTLLACINRYNYDVADSLIVFNLSDPSRFDLSCDHDHPDADKKNVPWDSQLIDYSFVNRQSRTIIDIEKNLGFKSIERMTSDFVCFLLNFLQHKKFDFYFLTMNDCLQTALTPVIDQFKNHRINLEPGSSMIEYCQRTGTCISADDHHPNLQGHQQIADQVFKHIQKNAI